ncbi:LL-diaminopimelate aminotransferase [bacterium]|nr:LL-diaminopimelate aminotransferase [bacterium]
MSKFEFAERIKKLPPYLFAHLDSLKKEAQAKGADIIDLGIGDPDMPTPKHIVASLGTASKDTIHHRYPSYAGMLSFRQAVAAWYGSRFGVKLDPEKEVLSLIGSKEGIGHIPFAFINPGDIVLVPDPGYPVYRNSVILAGGDPYTLPLLKENGFLPDFDAVDKKTMDQCKLLFLNYPNNPTSACAEKGFFEHVIELAHKHNFIVCHDAAYSEIAFDGYSPPSILQVEGAKDVAIEFHSLSKTYNMTGWRIGFAAGNRNILEGLGKVKTNLDSGIFEAIQMAGIAALTGPQTEVHRMSSIYQERRDLLCQGLEDLGLKLDRPKATFYVWVETPEGFNSTEFSLLLLNKCGIVCTPGVGFGIHGEGYFRIALTVDLEHTGRALERLSQRPWE